MPRALLEFRHIMPTQTFTPHSVKDTPIRPKLLISEYHKTLFRWAQIKTGT